MMKTIGHLFTNFKLFRSELNKFYYNIFKLYKINIHYTALQNVYQRSF